MDGKAPYRPSNIKQWGIIENTQHITIQYSLFRNAGGWYGLSLLDSQYNSILHNRIDRAASYSDPKRPKANSMSGDMIIMQCSNHNLIEDNYLTRGGHTLLTVNGNLNVIRRNTFENERGKNRAYRALELGPIIGFAARTQTTTCLKEISLGIRFVPQFKARRCDQSRGQGSNRPSQCVLRQFWLGNKQRHPPSQNCQKRTQPHIQQYAGEEHKALISAGVR